jgi:hypothetical protein
MREHGKLFPVQRIVVSLIAAACFSLFALAAVSGQQAGGSTVVVSAGFESGTAEGWIARGTESVIPTTEEKHTGAYGLMVSKRRFTWNGALHELPGPLARGATYHISVWVKYRDGLTTRPITFMNKHEWTMLEVDDTVPNDAALAKLDVYVETPYKADAQQPVEGTFAWDDADL